MNAQPGWYPDPNGSGHDRWWDGERWWPVSPPSEVSGCAGSAALVVFIFLLALVAVLVLASSDLA